MRALLGLLLVVATAPIFGMDATNVLIVANEKVEGSTEIAEYYSKMRGVPTTQILKISAGDKEEITRDEFNKDVLEPIKKFVLENDNILAIVPTRGVPLKIKQLAKGPKESFKGRDFASVDGELALIRYGDYDVDGVIENPILDSNDRITLESQILVISRLDGPTVEIAKGLVEKAILAEALGCYGESFLDTRGLTKMDGYRQRDDLMEKVEDSWKAGNLPYVHDTEPAVFDVSQRLETLHYYGWYASNPNKWKGDVKFRTGGICIHLHSFSGATVRDIKRNWVAPLLNWNATCTYGTTYEPYTTGFPYEHILWDRLVKGWSFGEAGQVANHLLSWQAVFCGDPLYTPYAEGHKTTQQSYLAATLARLLPPEDEAAPIDTDALVLLDSVAALLQARADDIKSSLRKDPKAALAAFNDLRFLVAGMNLGDWLTSLAGPFNAELDRRFDAIKRELKDEPTNTAALENALVDWQGLPVHEKLVELQAEVTEEHGKTGAKLLKKAKSSLKAKRWLKAWGQAAECAAHKFAESASEGQAILDELKGNAEAVERMTADTDKELQRPVEKAQKEFNKGKFERAAGYFPKGWRWLYSESEQYKAAVALMKKIKDAQNKAE